MGLHLRRIPLFRKTTANQVTALVSATREVNLTAGSILWDASREPALYYLLSGEVRIESGDGPPVVAGSGRTIGGGEPLAGAAAGRCAVVSKEGRALRLDRQELFEVLADDSDLLHGVFASVL